MTPHVAPPIVYRIVCSVNGKSYVGQTSRRLAVRMREHRRAKNMAIGRAIQKYGRAAFAVDVLERCDNAAEVDAAERFWIEWYESRYPKGYNLESGGSLLKHHSDASIARMGRPFPKSAEWRAKVSAAHTGRVVSEETKARLRAAWERGRERRRRPCSEETKRKIGEKNRVHAANRRAGAS